MRFGVILHPSGGALATMLQPVKLGLGTILGNGDQWVSWASREDCARAIEHLLGEESMSGPVNISTPEPVRQKDLMRALARALHHPVFLRLPSPFVRLLMGQMGSELLLCSTRMDSSKLCRSRFSFTSLSIPETISMMLR